MKDQKDAVARFAHSIMHRTLHSRRRVASGNGRTFEMALRVAARIIARKKR